MAPPDPSASGRDRSVLERLIESSGFAGADGIADQLLREFGSAGAVLSAAGTGRLRRCIGDERLDELIAATRDLLRCVLVGRVRERDALSGRKAVLDYLRTEMAFSRRENLRVLYLDAGHRIVVDEIASIGTVNSVAFHARDIIARALEVGAVGLILAHNHPSGVACATKDDVDATDALIKACAPLGIEVHDHLVIAEDGVASVCARGTP